MQDGVGDDDELSGDRGEGEPLGLSGRSEALVEHAQGRMGSGGAERGHEELGAQADAAADHSSASLGPRLAVTLEAAMLTAFGVIVQIPPLIARPAERSQWVEVFASFALAGAAWAFAARRQGRLRPFGRRRAADPAVQAG